MKKSSGTAPGLNCFPGANARLQGAEEALDCRVVPAVALAALEAVMPYSVGTSRKCWLAYGLTPSLWKSSSALLPGWRSSPATANSRLSRLGAIGRSCLLSVVTRKRRLRLRHFRSPCLRCESLSKGYGFRGQAQGSTPSLISARRACIVSKRRLVLLALMKLPESGHAQGSRIPRRADSTRGRIRYSAKVRAGVVINTSAAMPLCMPVLDSASNLSRFTST